MKRNLILPKESIILTEDDTKNIEGGTDGLSGMMSGMIMDIFAMTMNRLLTQIGYAIFDPIDAINMAIRNIFHPNTSSVSVETNNRTSLM